MAYTLGEAAKAVGLSKTAISKAIKSGKISAERQINGSFSIEPVELHRVYPCVKLTVKKKEDFTDGNPMVNFRKDIENEVLKVKLESEQKRNADLEKRIESLEKEKEDWKQQATRLLTFTPDKPHSLPQKTKQSIWSKLFNFIDLKK